MIHMNDEKVICMPAYNRPQYFQKVLQSLSRCTGIEDYVIIPCVEPGNEEVSTLAEQIDFAECRPVFNRRRLGCNGNLLRAIHTGFESANYVIIIEDDVLCAQDALLFFEYCRKKYGNDEQVLTITGYNRAHHCDPSSYHELGRRRWFVPWSWATWKDRWQMIEPDWPIRRHGISWDIRINQQFCQGQGRQEIYPLLSRAQNIGAEGGANVPSAQWHAQNQHVPFWADDADVSMGTFWENETP